MFRSLRVPAAAALGLLAVAPLFGRSPAPMVAEPRATEIVERAIAAHGGRERWLRMRDATYRTTWTHFVEGRPTVSSRYTIRFPIGSGLLRGRVDAEENGKPVMMGLSGLRSWFQIGSDRSEDPDVLRANRAFIRKAYGLLALPFRLDDPGHRFVYDGEEVRAGALVDRVRVEHGLEPAVLLLFDRESGRVAGMGSPVSVPPTTLLGEPRDMAEFDGLLIPRVHLFDRLDPATRVRKRTLMVSVDDVTFGQGLSPDLFEPPPIP